MAKWEDRFDDWLDRQSFDTAFLIAVSPLILIGLVLTIVGFVFG